MKRSQKIFALVGLTLLVAAVPLSQIAYGQEPTIMDFEGMTVEAVVIIVIFSGFGGLMRILIPFGKKYQHRLREIEDLREKGTTSTLRPLAFQWSYFTAWLLALPLGSLLALGFAMGSGISFTNWIPLMLNAFAWGLTATWFTVESQT